MHKLTRCSFDDVVTLKARWGLVLASLNLHTAWAMQKGKNIFRMEEERTVAKAGPALYRKMKRTTESYVVLTSRRWD
jgi:hypothetical protein